MSEHDLNRLKFLRDLASTNRTLISITSSLVDDMNANSINSIPLILQVTEYVEDMISPELEAFSHDMDEGILSLTFTETVLAESLDTEEITILSNSVEQNTSFSRMLVGDNVSDNYSTIITISLDPEDLNDLKRQPELAVSDNKTYISITMFDMNSNPVLAINTSFPLRVDNFNIDSTQPQLVAFTLDMDTNTLILTFSETVNATTFDPTHITLQNNTVITATHFTLTGGIFNIDANMIKAILLLAQEEANTFISIAPEVVQDMEGLYAQEIFNTTALLVSPTGRYIPDKVGPNLTSFDLDADTGLLTLEFDETVYAETLQLSKLVIQSHYMNVTSNYTEYCLRGRTSTTVISHIVEIQLSPADILNIKTQSGLAITNETTYLRLEEGAVHDTALSSNEVISDTLPVRNYTSDEAGPNITRFSVDLTRGVVTVNFNEPVLASSLNTTGFTAIAGPNSTSYYTLSGNATASINDFAVDVVLTVLELNVIKQIEDLWTHENNTYISVEPHFITDNGGNPVFEISRERPLQAEFFMSDEARPTLDYFQLDMNEGILFLHFSETVNITSFDISGITLQEVRNTYLMPEAHHYRLTNAEFISVGDVADVILRLS